jgi:hypothetical protein
MKRAARKASVRNVAAILGRMAILAFCLGSVPIRARAMSVTPPSFPVLVGEAEQIARVRVTAVESRWDDGPAGRVIHTYVHCLVLRTLKGAASGSLVLRLLGGTVDGSRLIVPGMPSFEVGGTYVVFVAQNGRSFCPLVRAGHGVYRVAGDGAAEPERVLRGNGRPLTAVEDVALPLDPAGFAAGSSAAVSGALTRKAFEEAISSEVRHGAQP